jgi:DNA-binding response OmpR family regulator
MSGLEMIERAREIGYQGPIILCSALPEAQFPPHRARYDLFLMKPYDARTLLAALQNLQQRD